MNNVEKTTLVNQFHAWLKSVFLTEEHQGHPLAEDEWELHLNRLTFKLSSFLFCWHPCDQLMLHEPQAIFAEYGKYLHALIPMMFLEHQGGSPPRMRLNLKPSIITGLCANGRQACTFQQRATDDGVPVVCQSKQSS